MMMSESNKMSDEELALLAVKGLVGALVIMLLTAVVLSSVT